MSTPQNVRNRTSGTYWLVVGGILIAIAVVVLAVLTTREPGIAWTAIIVDLLLYVVMVVARFAVHAVVPRQWTLAICLMAAAVLTLGALFLMVEAQA
jgi:hypothetical protein